MTKITVLDPSSREKKKTLTKLLEEGAVLVHLATGFEGLIVPDRLKNTPMLTLKLSLRFPRPMKIEDDKVVAELKFGDEYFVCHIPWGAFWAMTGIKGEYLMWPTSLTSDLLASLNAMVQTMGEKQAKEHDGTSADANESQEGKEGEIAVAKENAEVVESIEKPKKVRKLQLVKNQEIEDSEPEVLLEKQVKKKDEKTEKKAEEPKEQDKALPLKEKKKSRAALKRIK